MTYQPCNILSEAVPKWERGRTVWRSGGLCQGRVMGFAINLGDNEKATVVRLGDSLWAMLI
jgi:hypothetical protein